MVKRNIIPTAVVLTVVVAAITTVTIATSFNLDTQVFAKHELNGTLSGQQEVPPVDTMATGAAEFLPILPSNETVDFSINATSIEGVTAGHIHSGIEGENGPIVVTLFQFDPAQNEVTERGTITADMLEGAMEGMSISDLLTAMKNGSTYVNIHTEQNPDGEIRGQITSPYN
ncbi:MAG: CHRD domain-containing protein [Nitrososphaeraceae archaeon]